MTSVLVEGLKEFVWVPNKNVIAHASFPPGENTMPRVTFMEVPSMRKLSTQTLVNSTDLKLYYHPSGNFLAVVNDQKAKTKFSIELFDTKDDTF